MEWVVKLEARSGRGEVETIEVGRIERWVVGLTAEKFGLTLAEGKHLLGELARLLLQTQMEEYTTCAFVPWVHEAPSAAGQPETESPDTFRDDHHRRAAYQCLPFYKYLGLRGCPVREQIIRRSGYAPAVSNGVHLKSSLRRSVMQYTLHCKAYGDDVARHRQSTG